MSVAFLALLACSGPTDPSALDAQAAALAKTPNVRSKIIFSKPYRIDKKYMSMRGPYGFDDVVLHEAEQPELLWIVGYKTSAVEPDSDTPVSQEFVCHANLDFDAKDYYARFPGAPPLSGRVFTLSQGQQDIRFPEGFGIPVSSDLPITLATQVLNLNIEEPKGIQVRHKVEIYYVRDAEVQGEMIPLFQGAAEGFKALGDAKHYGFDEGEDPMGSGCSVGRAALPGDADEDVFGQKFTAHWIVEPGEEVNVTNVTKFLNLPYDTAVHYIAVHLHPYGERLLLKDITSDTVIFDAKARQSTTRVGLEGVDHLSSVEGVRLYKDHQYELTSWYQNTSEADVDSMAVMYMYMRDLKFTKPDLSAAAAPAPKADNSERGPGM
jgi:hypothetical protein